AAATRRPSARAWFNDASTRFVASFAADPDPTGPVWNWARVIAAGTGRTAANTSGSAPTMAVMVPASARLTLPDTGASTSATPAARAFPASARTAADPMVPIHT